MGEGKRKAGKIVMGEQRYDAEQWALMNSPEMQEKIRQEKIRQSLKGYLRSFLDTAPEGRTQERYLEVLSFLKHYFKKEFEESETDYTDLVLSGLSYARKLIPTEEKMKEILSASRRPVTQADIDGWERIKKEAEQAGLDGWWD